ncbi:type VI secretion system membrane subunit TssM [Vibrio parahaemolyticus]|nr:type VI secretion system membrane subunit TssM [Vibrio parahaemolyticus]EGQ9477851.1 type VI secretion system membrane subunit TssM [Vibrio parahaemolyticus]EJG0186134.1 type VI secretion system membrane subunit TssM [Vibrio parahaemolyticus]EJG0190940.1 type VI secretion system membrane subunit TssM [Vibrio parahaemolyticus]
MFKKIFSIFLVITAILGTLAFWITASEEQPVWIKWGMLAVTVVIVFFTCVWWWKQRKLNQTEKEEHDQHVLLKQDTRVIQQLFRIATKKIQGQARNKLESLYSLPWYLVLGGEKDAKSAILLQNGFEPVNERYLDESDTEQYLRFWSNDNAVVVEVGHRIFDNDGIDESLWQVLAKQLLKYRPRQGLNGIVTVIGCDRLMTGDKKERTRLSGIYQEAVLSMGAELSLNLPVYAAFSKADSIADFIGFFESFTTCDSENPFGITFECDVSRRYDKQQFEAESHALIQSIAGQQFELLRNVGSDKSGSIIAWPYQLRIFLERVNEFLSDIGRENRVREAVWIRGAYLMSSGQKGIEHDLLTQLVAERAEFNTNNQVEQQPNRRGFFTQRLFNKVILPEKNIVGVNEWRHAGYLVFRTAVLVSVVGLISVAGLKLQENWNVDEDWRTTALSQIRFYQNDVQKLSNDNSMSEVVAVLRELGDVVADGVQPKPWHEKVSIKQTDTAESVYSAYEKQLHQIMLPKLEELISSELYVYVNLGNPSRIFEILRYYQMLFDREQLNFAELQTYLLDNLKDQGELSPDELYSFSLLIEDLFKSHYDKQLQPNLDLIAVATNNLEGLSPERLIYARIKEMPEYRTQVDLRSQLGEKFNSLFEFTNDFHGYLIPEIFTKQGYSQIDLTAKSPLLRSLMSEFKAIQGDMSGASVIELRELSKQVQRLYFADYIYYWKDLVNNIQIKQFGDASGLSYALRNTRSPATSPLLDVLDAVVVNTTLAVADQPDTKGQKRAAGQLGLKKAKKVLNKADKVNRAVGDNLLRLQPSFVVNEAFLPFSRFVNGNGKDKDTPLEQLIVQVDEVNSFFDAALSSSNPGKSFHAYAIAHAQGSSDPIVNFRQAGSKAPNIVASWTKSLSEQVWKQVVNGSVVYLNTQWDEQVYQFYVSAIEGRFPFDQHGRGEVSLDDFSQFFKPSGRVARYIEETLKPFVYWDNGRLKLNEVDGLALPINSNTRKQLELVQKLSGIFFGSSGDDLGLRLEVKASSMSTDVTEFRLREAETIYDYKHGPRVWREITWPTAGVDGYLSAEFYSGQNRVAQQSFTGQWALLRAIFANKSSATSSRLIRKLNYKINQNNIVLDYTLRDSKQPLDKSLFVQFSLPKQL